MRLATLLAVWIPAASVQADILHLRDGSRHYGELISQTDAGVMFRIFHADGSSTVVRHIAAAQVNRVERTGRRDVAPCPPAPEFDAPEPINDRPQMLREAYELLDDGDFEAATRALHMAVSGASAEVLSDLDQRCRAARGLPLGELLATARVYVATRTAGGRGFRLARPTRYERPALARVLSRQTDLLLERQYDQRTLKQWLADGASVTELRPDARRLVADLTRAAALIKARLRYDRALRRNRDETLRLTRLQTRLSRWAAQVYSRPGYFELSPEDGWKDPADTLVKKLTASRRPTTRPHAKTKSETTARVAANTRDN